MGGLSWAQVGSGAAVLGAVIKDAKEQLRALPDPLSYGLLRYLNDDVDLDGPEPHIGFNYLGRLGFSGRGLASGEGWSVSENALSSTGAAMAVPMALAHTLELNAVTVDTDAGPHLQANWTWAPSALDEPRVKRLSRAVVRSPEGICAHVRNGGGGLTPSDVAPARLSQQQIDELQLQDGIADILPLTPLQQGLLFHAGTAPASGDTYAVQLDFTLAGPLDPHRLRDAVQTVVTRHPHLVARFHRQFDEPVQVIPAEPVAEWRYADLSESGSEYLELIRELGDADCNAVGDLARPPGFRVALIRVAPERHRLLLTSITSWWTAGRCRSWCGRSSPPTPGRDCPLQSPTAASSNGWPSATLEAARGAWRETFVDFDTPTLVGPKDRMWLGERGFRSFVVSERTTRALGEVARSHRTTVSTVLQGAWALLLTSLTGRHDVAFGTPRSRVGQAEVSGAESMVGLLINTVPVRARITPTTTTAELLEQLQGAHNELIEHQHLALNEIHRIAGHDQLFDTLFVYENYPIDTTAPLGVDGLAITEFSNRENNHYPLTVEALPGREIGLRVEYDADVFDETASRRSSSDSSGSRLDDRRSDPTVVVDGRTGSR